MLRNQLKSLQKELVSNRSRLEKYTDSKSVIVFAPHQDDETLGCGGVIRKRILAGCQITVVYLTDGSTSHANFISRSELAELRKAEAIAACKVLGIPKNRVVFLDYADGNLSSASKDTVTDIKAILHEYQPDEIFFPYRYDLTPDHVAASKIIRQAVEKHPQNIFLYEYPIWYWFHWPWIGIRGLDPYLRKMWLANSIKTGLGFSAHLKFNVSCDIRDQVETKKEALAKHKTQMVKMDGNVDWPILSEIGQGDFLQCFFRDREFFYRHESKVKALER